MATRARSGSEPDDRNEPPSRDRVRRRIDPDKEAMALMANVIERVAVARSFTRIAASLVTLGAIRVAQESALKARYDRVRKIARAATEAAIHVATHRAQDERDERDRNDSRNS